MLYAMTTGTEKRRKCTSQIFHFWNFVTQILVKRIERFSKKIKTKIWRRLVENQLPLLILLVVFLLENRGYSKNAICHDDRHGKTKKMYISDFSFLKLRHTDFSKTYWEIFKKNQNKNLYFQKKYCFKMIQMLWNMK